MFGQSLIKAAGLASILYRAVVAVGCIPRDPGQFLENTSFEAPDSFAWDSRGAALQSTPTYPAYSGDHSLLVTASYSKTAEGAAINNYAFVQQFVGSARTGNVYQIKAHYKVLSHTKGASCPDTSLPLTDCKLKLTYVTQVIDSIHLNPTSGYVELSVPFIPESGGRYLNFNLECKPAALTPGCGEALILLDDITWTDPGHTCWTPLGCFTDSTSARVLTTSWTAAQLALYHNYRELPSGMWTPGSQLCRPRIWE